MIISKEYKKHFKSIAKLYGAKVIFHRGLNEASYDCKGTIYLNEAVKLDKIISLFCHELGHHKNRLTNKFPLYHDLKTVYKMENILKSNEKTIDYILKAEIYTEKIGKEICKEWFPNVKYIAFYKNNSYCRGYLEGVRGH